MSATTRRDADGQPQVRARGGIKAVVAVSVMAITIIAVPHGFSAAAGETLKVKAADTAPITLAGRWSGPRYAYNLRAPGAQNCGGKACTLTYDIVACPEGWCGIAVTDDKPCGAIALHLKSEVKPNGHEAFMGKLELAKGSAPYVVEAWYNPAGKTAGEGRDQAHLNMVGDTGEMLMMRRSFPFQAELARTGDAQCTLEKATS